MSVAQILLISISGLGIFHGLFVAILLWSTDSKSNISNKILGCIMFVLSLRVGKSVLLVFTDNLPILYIYLGLCLMLFIGPLFLLYSKALVKRLVGIAPGEFTHFAPGLVFIVLALPLQTIGFNNIPDWIAGMFYIFFYLHFLGYVLFVKFKIIRQLDSPAETRLWLNILFFGLIAIWLEYVMNLFEEQIPYILGPIVYSITVYTITFLAYKHNYLTVVNAVKYQTAGLKEEEASALFLAVERIVQVEKLFLDTELSLPSLSKRLNVSSQKLSMAINSRSGYNFKEYINKYRILYAKEILADPKFASLSIAAIAYDCGFNSLSSFNSAFKKITGKTPSAFKKQLNDDN